MPEKINIKELYLTLNQLPKRTKLLIIIILVFFAGNSANPVVKKILEDLDTSNDVCVDEEWMANLPNVIPECVALPFEAEMNNAQNPLRMALNWLKDGVQVSLEYVNGVYSVGRIENVTLDRIGEFTDAELAAFAWLNQIEDGGEIQMETSYQIDNDIMTANMSGISPRLAELQKNEVDVFATKNAVTVSTIEDAAKGTFTLGISIHLSDEARMFPSQPRELIIIFNDDISPRKLTPTGREILSFLPAPVLEKVDKYAAVEV